PWPATDPMADVPALEVGQPGTFDFLFCRDLVREHTNPGDYGGGHSAPPPATADKLIKSMINFELHGLMDCAVDLAEHFRPVLAGRLDVDLAIKHLVHRPPQTRNIAELANAMGIIAPLRRQVEQCQRRVQELKGELIDRDLKATSVRFLARALMRETAARARRRLGMKDVPTDRPET